MNLRPAYRSHTARRASRSAARGPRSAGRVAGREARGAERGFTLIELIVVVTIIGILAGIAISNVRYAQQKAREAALKDDLHEMRKAIDDYYADKQKYPDALQTLKTDRYLRDIPKDPMTGKPDWQEVQASTDPNDPTANPAPTDNTAGTPGIYDVHSNAPGMGLDGTPYKDW